jgi:hypothetical protein
VTAILLDATKKPTTLNSMPKMKGLCLLASLFICLQLAGCQLPVNNGQSVPEDPGEIVLAEVFTAITLANGQIVSNCGQYTNARSAQRIMETVNNTIVASEYLPCSLTNTRPLETGEVDSVTKQLLALSVRRLPLSIAQLYGRKTLLAEAGFNQVDNKLLWSAGQHRVVVQVIARASDVSNRYLIWVSDVIADGNYYAYYPAWIETSPDSTMIQVMPVYQSGF